MLILTLLACPPIELESLPLAIGLGGVTPTGEGNDLRWTAAGTVSEVGNSAPDEDFDQIPITSATNVLRVALPDDGEAVFAWSSLEDLDVPVAEGDEVSLLVAQRQPWGIGQDAVLRDGTGALVAAFGIEGWGRAMEDADLPEVSPTLGAEVDRVPDECGRKIGHEIDFGGTGVRPFGGSRLDLEAGTFTGWAFGAWEYDADSVTCSDVAGELNWAVVQGFSNE